MSEATTLEAGQETTATGEQQPADLKGQTTDDAAAQAAAGTEGKKDDAAAPTYELKMPEGLEIDTDAQAELVAYATERKLSPEDTQKLADIGAKMVQKMQAGFEKTSNDWRAAVEADKEIGGDKLAESLALAKKARDTFGTPELTEYLDQTKLGNHPALVKFFVKAGKSIAEDGFVKAGSTVGAKSAAETLYGSN